MSRFASQFAPSQWELGIKKRSGYTTSTPLGPGRDVTSGLEGLVGSYNQAYGQAQEANEARYQQLLGIADQTTGQRAADIQGAYGQQSSNIMQRLGRLGLANTTIAPTMQMGVEREKQAALDRSADQMQQTKLGIIERRQDEGPSLENMQSIISGIGSQFGRAGLPSMIQALSGLGQRR
jgi:hypothetical protein